MDGEGEFVLTEYHSLCVQMGCSLRV